MQRVCKNHETFTEEKRESNAENEENRKLAKSAKEDRKLMEHCTKKNRFKTPIPPSLRNCRKKKEANTELRKINIFKNQPWYLSDISQIKIKKNKIKIRKETKNEENLKPTNPNAIFEIQPISSQPPEKNEERKWTWTSKGRQETARNTFTGEQTVPVPWRTMTETKKKRGWEIAFRDRVERVELAALQRKRRRSSRDRGQGSRPWFLSTGRTYIDRVTERRGRGERNKGVGTRGCRRDGKGLHTPSTGRKSDLGSLRHFLWTLSLFFSPGFSVPFSSSYSSFSLFLFFFFLEGTQKS